MHDLPLLTTIAAARVLVRAHYLREREDLERAGASAVVFEEAEAAVALARRVLADTGANRDVVERKVRELLMHAKSEGEIIDVLSRPPTAPSATDTERAD